MTITESCTGCGLCSQICPTNSILMIPDKEGFLIPHVNISSCIHCNLCVKKCPQNIKIKAYDSSIYYCAINSNDKDLFESSSGGMFIAFAKYILSIKGIVCGCIYDKNMVARHICSDNIAIVRKMCGSKYVQSDITSCYSQINKYLKSDLYVLFTGTACQIAALSQFLGKDYDKLYLIDILCHGVPSPDFFARYVKVLEKKYKGKVTNIEFRNKEKRGWGSEHRTCIYLKTKNGSLKKRPFLPAYFCAFFWGLNLRNSCYKCRYAGALRISDITIGDYWGYWNKYHRKFNEGLSVLSINSSKGQRLFEINESQFKMFELLSPEEAKGTNVNFYHSTKLEKGRAKFYLVKGRKYYFKYIVKTFCNITQFKKLLRSLYGKIVPENISNFIRKLRRR